ncbi:MAG: outer membrane protein assembly factor BamD [Candidatus Didemnitutus sp.]|nr:outer membrane protein assembly factor BamD [Candidatus Didemnitutus sp.]
MSRRTLSAFVAVVIALFGAARLSADLVWTPGQGWRIEGGALAGLSGEEGHNALEMMNTARNAEEKGSTRSAIKTYEKVAKKYPNSLYAGEALYRIGLLYEKRKQYFKSFESFQEMVMKYPSSQKFSQVIAEQYRIAQLLLDGARSYMWGVIPGFKNREKSVEYFEQIVHNAPYSDYAPLSLMNIARAHQKMGNTEEAIDALDRMINNYPKNVLTPDAYLKLAQTHSSLVDGAYYDQASTKEAITYYEDYLIQFPGDSGAGTAEKGLGDMKSMLAQSKMILADYYFKYRKNYTAAKVFYNEAITTYPDSPVAARARKMLVEVDSRLAGNKPQDVKDDQPAAPKKKKRFWLF